MYLNTSFVDKWKESYLDTRLGIKSYQWNVASNFSRWASHFWNVTHNYTLCLYFIDIFWYRATDTLYEEMLWPQSRNKIRRIMEAEWKVARIWSRWKRSLYAVKGQRGAIALYWIFTTKIGSLKKDFFSKNVKVQILLTNCILG